MRGVVCVVGGEGGRGDEEVMVTLVLGSVGPL